jgi:MFS superfamily sulfate permease-like transporter
VDDDDDEFLRFGEAGARERRHRILRNAVAVLLVVFFLLTLFVSYRIGVVVSLAAAALYAIGQCLSAGGRGGARSSSEDSSSEETVH